MRHDRQQDIKKVAKILRDGGYTYQEATLGCSGQLSGSGSYVETYPCNENETCSTSGVKSMRRPMTFLLTSE